MSAASESSGAGFSSGSGRSTPDDGRFPANASSSLASNSHPHAFSPFGSAWGPRRSSTPATSFLTPRFWGGSSSNTAGSVGSAGHRIEEHKADPSATGQPSSHLHSGGSQLHQSLSHGGGVIHESSDETANPSPTSSFINVPRRVSFGHALSGGNRLGAFSALGLGPSSPYWTQSTSPQKSHDSAAGKPGLARTGTADEGALSSANTTPAPSMPSSPVQKPQKTRTVYLPGPDGICVESRAKRGH